MVSMGRASVEEVLIIFGLLLVQAVYGVHTVFLNQILALGFNPLFMVVAGSFTSSLILLPFSIIFERNKWPTRLTLSIMVQFCLIAFGGVTMCQGLMLLGIKRTTPYIASAMPNLVPGLVFIISACLKFEKFSIWCKYGRAKALGAAMCLGGAMVISFMQSPQSASSPKTLSIRSEVAAEGDYKDWVMGCSFLLAAIVIASFIMVLQAIILINFSAPFSVCVITSLMGSIFTAIVQILTEGRVDVGSPSIGILYIVAMVVVGSMVGSSCIVYQTWCVIKKGPLVVSIFSPVQTMSAAFLSAILLREAVSSGRYLHSRPWQTLLQMKSFL
ncbi:hypothetical protein HPP92_022144 [Vanilla planifolia]|uniref:WAT1-related protein n=1 Tax=Vanilla planifolia TaxID=51239 RepID=A0A835PV56_VANPL|nr:hypothetical protein HPP92_022144 [Vanilla planifolia]